MAGVTAGAFGLAGGMATTGGWLSPNAACAEPEEHVAYTFHYRHCQCNCHLKCTVRDGRLALIEPNDWPNKRNETVCLKGLSEVQHTYSPDRLQTPLKRVGERGEGKFEAITWDEALDTIAAKVKEIWEKDGSQAIAFQTAVDALTTNLPKLLRGQEKPKRGIDIGLGNGFSPALAESGQQGASSHEVTDWKNAKTILNVGCNVLETCMVTSKYFFDAKEAGAEIITFDPNFCITAAKSSQWVPMVAGTDAALYLGLISIILENKWYNAQYLKDNTSMPFLVKRSDGSLLRKTATADITQAGSDNPFQVYDENAGAVADYNKAGISPKLDYETEIGGEKYATVFTLLLESQKAYTAEWAAETTGISVEKLMEVADKYANHGPSILSFGFGGGEKFYNADVAGHSAVLLATLVGSFGTDIPGWGAGAYVNAYQKIFGAGKLAGWELPAECTTAKAPKGTVDYRDDKSGIKMMWVQNGAFQQIAGNQNRTDEWAKTLDFVVVQDIWHTPSVDWADIVLPVCSHFECDEEIGFLRALREHEQIESTELLKNDLGSGVSEVEIRLPRGLYYQSISEQTGLAIENDRDLIALLTEMSAVKSDYDRLRGALRDVREKGYGVVMPDSAQMTLEEPQIVRQGGKYSVKLKANAPAIHMIMTDVETEVTPAIGGEGASEDIINFLLQGFDGDVNRIWQSNIFGKSLNDIAEEGLTAKLEALPENVKEKLRDTLERLINEGSGGLICILL